MKNILTTLQQIKNSEKEWINMYIEKKISIDLTTYDGLLDLYPQHYRQDRGGDWVLDGGGRFIPLTKTLNDHCESWDLGITLSRQCSGFLGNLSGTL